MPINLSKVNRVAKGNKIIVKSHAYQLELSEQSGEGNKIIIKSHAYQLELSEQSGEGKQEICKIVCL